MDDSLPIYCPPDVDRGVHPQVDQVEERAWAMACQSGMGRTARERARMKATSGAQFMSRLAPDAELEAVTVCAAWIYWGFIIDDAYFDGVPPKTTPDRVNELTARFQRAFAFPGYVPEEPLGAVLAALGGHFRRQFPPHRLQRLLWRGLDWYVGLGWGLANRARQQSFSLDEYMLMRPADAGAQITLGLSELCVEPEAPAWEVDTPVVRALESLAGAVAALDNDRQSMHREKAGGFSSDHVFAVIARERGCSVADAVPLGIALRDRLLDRFIELRAAVEARSVSPGLRQWLRQLACCISGNAAWGEQVTRYRVGQPGESAAPGLLPVSGRQFSDKPLNCPEAPDPARLPSLSWIWDDRLLGVRTA
ncbi:terpene synthase family protein [Streptomyces cellulosae]|uniref:Terpene synthase family protein n=1 Tax=Streptomyces cellulosae TaxID=1968 RepID=A0ABW6JFZ4_STRCE